MMRLRLAGLVAAALALAPLAATATAARSQTFAKTVDGTPYVALLAVYALDATRFVAVADVSSVTR